MPRAGQIEQRAVAKEALGNRKVVRWSTTSGQVELAIADGNRKHACGVTLYSVSLGDEIVFQQRDILDGFTGLTVGSPYYLSQVTAGEITNTRPSSGEIQRIGFAKSSTELDLAILFTDKNVPTDGEKTNLGKVLIPAEVQIIDSRGLLPVPGSSASPTAANETSSSFAVKSRFIFNFTRLNQSGTTSKGTLYVQGYCDSGATGEVRIYNSTDGVQLGLISFTETSSTIKSVELASLPTTGQKVLTLEMRRATGFGSAKFSVETATVDFRRES